MMKIITGIVGILLVLIIEAIKYQLFMALDLAIKLGVFVVSLIALIKGVYEYQKAQKWKKAEFVSKEIKEFFSDFDVKRALLMLDWGNNEIDLRPNEIARKKKLEFDDKIIEAALKTHLEVDDGFTEEEALVKTIFDVLFDKLIMFEHFIKSGLVKSDDIKPYLIYWIEIIANPLNDRKPEFVKEQMFKYIDLYGYQELRRFFERFGFKIKY
ncbi:MAG: hypothetical protein Q8909_09845 [Bacteroidota bacterium]|nr:hypothetical protein [Bacteroidota bacterium]